MKPLLFYILVLAFSASNQISAQQYKLRQVTNMMNMKNESTIYVKGMRKRTETSGYMGIGGNIVTIEQCDLQRTIKLNVKKKLYLIDPFGKDESEINDEDAKPAAVKSKPVAKPVQEKGGVIHMYYNITDTGERKEMFGFTARHIWTTQKIKPSAEACTMKDSMAIKTDGWYIDLPLFNCPVNYVNTSAYKAYEQQMTCKDKYVTHRSGKGKLGFPLVETRTMIMGGVKTTTDYKTDLETLELSTVKLDSMLFEIPPGYSLAASEEELQDKIDYSDVLKAAKANPSVIAGVVPAGEKKPGTIRIGVFKPTSEETLQLEMHQTYLAGSISSSKVEGVVVNSAEEAKKLNCDYVLNSSVTRLKQASKVGGILKAIKNSDPTAATSYNVEGNMILTKTGDGSVAGEQKVSGKFDGKPDEATRKALEASGRSIINSLK